MGYLVAEAVEGIATYPRALLADAGITATEFAWLGLALQAILFAERPTTSRRTYG